MKRKLGSFLLLIGLILLLLFFASDYSGNTDFQIFFAGILALFLSFVLTRNKENLDGEKARFRMVRKLGSRGSKKEE